MLVELAILLVAIASMVTSLVVAWNIYLSPFNPKIFADTLVLKPVGGLDPLDIDVPILFVNAGSQGGIIQDIAMSIKTIGEAQSKQMLWRALHRIDTDPIEWVRATGDADYETPEVWHGLYLEGKEQKLVGIWFTPHGDAQDAPGFDQDLDFSAGQYQARIKIYHSGKWHAGTDLPLVLEERDANRLTTGEYVFHVTTGASVPTPDDFEQRQD